MSKPEKSKTNWKPLEKIIFLVLPELGRNLALPYLKQYLDFPELRMPVHYTTKQNIKFIKHKNQL